MWSRMDTTICTTPALTAEPTLIILKVSRMIPVTYANIRNMPSYSVDEIWKLCRLGIVNDTLFTHMHDSKHQAFSRSFVL